jgi:hypothetical protein
MRYSAVALITLLSACNTTTKEAAGVVVVSDRSAVASCRNLGQIYTQSLWGGAGATDIANDNALTELKNEAADRGATHVLLVIPSNSLRATNLIGDGYRC